MLFLLTNKKKVVKYFTHANQNTVDKSILAFYNYIVGYDKSIHYLQRFA